MDGLQILVVETVGDAISIEPRVTTSPLSVKHLRLEESRVGICGVITRLLNPDNVGLIDFNLTHCFISPGGESVAHYHRETSEFYICLRGKALINVGGVESSMSEGDCVFIPAFSEHEIINDTEDEFEILVVNHPQYNPTDVYSSSDGGARRLSDLLVHNLEENLNHKATNLRIAWAVEESGRVTTGETALFVISGGGLLTVVEDAPMVIDSGTAIYLPKGIWFELKEVKE